MRVKDTLAPAADMSVTLIPVGVRAVVAVAVWVGRRREHLALRVEVAPVGFPTREFYRIEAVCLHELEQLVCRVVIVPRRVALSVQPWCSVKGGSRGHGKGEGHAPLGPAANVTTQATYMEVTPWDAAYAWHLHHKHGHALTSQR